MIHKISGAITKWLVKAGAISEEDKELYEYAAFSFLFTLLPLALVLILGAVFGMLLEGVLLILPFMLIRKFSGGYHLKSSVVCTISSTVLLSLFLLVIRVVTAHSAYPAYSIAVGMSVLLLIVLSPIDSEERRLNERERIVFKKAAVVIALAVGAVYAVLMLCSQPGMAVSVGSGLVLSALLQLPCLVSRLVAGKKAHSHETVR